MEKYTPGVPSADTIGDEATSQRGAVRDSLLLSARLRGPEGVDETVRVRNLSAGGLMAEYAAPIGRGVPVQVNLRGIGWVSGTIAWFAEGRIGIAFDQEIDPLAARSKVTARNTSLPKPAVRRPV